MSAEATDRLVELLEKSLMVQLHSMGVPQGDIAKMLNKRLVAVNAFLKPLVKGKGKR